MAPPRLFCRPFGQRNSQARVFARDYPDSSKDDIPRAVQFLRALGEGRDPDTNAALDPARIFSPSYAAWLRYCAQTVEKASYNGESRAAEKKVCYLLRENIGKIQLSDDPVSASKLAERVNAVREPYGKAFTSVMVGAFFLAAGFVAEDAAYKRKAPTGIGGEYGVSSEMRVSQKGIRYSLLLYGRAAQQFFIDNIDHCVEVLDAPLTVPSEEEQPWMVGEDELLQRRFHEGAMIGDLAKEIGRPPSVIRKRLHSFGLNEGKSERDRSWRSWTEAEQKELLHQYTTGYRLEEIARLHKRSIAAIIVRLKRLGVET